MILEAVFITMGAFFITGTIVECCKSPVIARYETIPPTTYIHYPNLSEYATNRHSTDIYYAYPVSLDYEKPPDYSEK